MDKHKQQFDRAYHLVRELEWVFAEQWDDYNGGYKIDHTPAMEYYLSKIENESIKELQSNKFEDAAYDSYWLSQRVPPETAFQRRKAIKIGYDDIPF
jgi:hypothetical protein